MTDYLVTDSRGNKYVISASNGQDAMQQAAASGMDPISVKNTDTGEVEWQQQGAAGSEIGTNIPEFPVNASTQEQQEWINKYGGGGAYEYGYAAPPPEGGRQPPTPQVQISPQMRGVAAQQAAPMSAFWQGMQQAGIHPLSTLGQTLQQEAERRIQTYKWLNQLGLTGNPYAGGTTAVGYLNEPWSQQQIRRGISSTFGGGGQGGLGGLNVQSLAAQGPEAWSNIVGLASRALPVGRQVQERIAGYQQAMAPYQVTQQYPQMYGTQATPMERLGVWIRPFLGQ